MKAVQCYAERTRSSSCVADSCTGGHHVLPYVLDSQSRDWHTTGSEQCQAVAAPLRGSAVWTAWLARTSSALGTQNNVLLMYLDNLCAQHDLYQCLSAA